MEFGLSAEQLLLQESVRRFLERLAPLERVKSFVNDCDRRASDVWTGLCDLGIPGMFIAERHGGIGLSLLDAALVAEVLGAHVTPVPYVASVVMVPLAIAESGSDAQQSQWLPALAAGRIVAGAAISEAANSRVGAQVRANATTLSGKASFVLDSDAELYLVADQYQALYLVEANATGLKRRALPTIDGTRIVGELVLDNVTADLLPGSRDPHMCARVMDAGRLILAADTLGAASHMLDRAVAYSKQRVQFGRVIGSFQAVRHICAEMAAELEPCRAMMWYAAHAFDALPDDARLAACHTKAHISETGTFVARIATEVHGGIGFTDELGLHFWFKRIGANRQLLGGPIQLREEAAKLQQLV